MQKKILHILDGRPKKITETETVLQPLPHKDFRFANPFIVLHHMLPETIPSGSIRRIHPHPHRGFSPVTIMLQGEGFHRDNSGNEGHLAAGDAQWMFAGKGLLHSEGPTERLLREGGNYELIQLWINSPARHKWDPPYYQLAPLESQPLIATEAGIQLRLLAGHYDGYTGPFKSHTPVTLINGKMDGGAQLQLMARPEYWTLLYITSGQIRLNGETINEHQLVVFEKENDEILVSSCEDTTLLYLCAAPLTEPVAASGNFVMNTQAEIDQAKADDKAGVFGQLSN